MFRYIIIIIYEVPTGGVVGYGGRILTKNMALDIARFVRRP